LTPKSTAKAGAAKVKLYAKLGGAGLIEIQCGQWSNPTDLQRHIQGLAG